MDKVKHIVQFSGGKDSTCMLLMMLEKGMPVDDIIFCDTGMEFPGMYEHIDKVEQYIGRPITRLKAENSFEYMMFNYKRVKRNNKEITGYGWASMNIRWCTSYFKRDLSKKFMKGFGKTKVYIGIAADEPKRHRNIDSNIIHPLFDWGITEKMALSFCYELGFTWGGMYDKFSRVSCWCCPLQSIKQLRTLYHDFPDLWVRLREMIKKAGINFEQIIALKLWKKNLSVKII